MTFDLMLPQLEDHVGSCANINRLKWGPFSPNKVSRITQHITEKERKTAKKKTKMCPSAVFEAIWAMVTL
jgi:hypothetical protein